jgi:ArsR family transcriptional regulator
MSKKNLAGYEARAEVLKALAHPTRLFIVDVLANGSKNVSQLTELIGDDMSTVSKHLALLKSAGIVAGEKSGVQIVYKLKMPCVLNFFGCVETVLKEKGRELLKVVK